MSAVLGELLGERSQNNSLIKHVVGLYLYGAGVKRQTISVLHSFGYCSSYPSIAGSISTNRPLEETPPSTRPPEPIGHMQTSVVPGAPTTHNTEDHTEDDPDWLPPEEDLPEEPVLVPEEDDEDDSDNARNGVNGQPLENYTMSTPTPHGVTSAAPDVIGGARPEEAPTVPFIPLSKRGVGLLRRVCESCRTTARQIANSLLCGHVYDNINWLEKIAEQIVNRKDTQENGTCATIFPLYGATPEHMQTSDLLASQNEAPPLSISDILHTPAEVQLFQQSLEHALLRELVNNHEAFARFRKDVDACLPGRDDHIPLHKTELYPLPAMQIDESSIVGNAEVLDTVFKELSFDIGTTKFSGIVRPIFGDQLSISRLRTLIANRSGHDTAANSYAHIAFCPGLFHYQMALVHGILLTWIGDPSTGVRDPTTLTFFNGVLDRKPIVPTSLPSYRTMRDLLFHVLAAATTVCLLDVSEASESDLGEYASKVTFDELRTDVSKILTQKASPRVVATLRHKRADEQAQHTADSTPSASRQPASESGEPHAKPSDPGADSEELASGDMAFENMTLMLRDLLVLREFTDAIKGGYSGRIIRVLKVLALMYRGLGRTKYAHELLHLLHNLTHVWPKPLRCVWFELMYADSTDSELVQLTYRHCCCTGTSYSRTGS